MGPEIFERLEKTRINFKLAAAMLTVQFLGVVILTFGLIEVRLTLSHANEVFIYMDILCMIIATIFSLSIVRSLRINHETSAIFLIIFFDTAHLFSDGMFIVLNGITEQRFLNSIINIVFLLCPILIMLTYWIMLSAWVKKDFKHSRWADYAMFIIGALGTLLILGNLAFPYYFGITEDGHYYRGELYILTIVIPLIMAVFCAVRIVKCSVSLFEKTVLLSYLVVPVLASMVQNAFEQSATLAISMFASIVLIYTNFYSTREAELMNMESELSLSKLYLLQMQINPHMIFNTMSSIAGMCDIDPQKSKDMIYKLSDYMRDVFNDLDNPSMVSLQEELEHLDHYIEIQTMRFPNITVVKDIETWDFNLPRMSLQPLVENAIKHGICKRKKSEGTLKIGAYEIGDFYAVSIEDDGVGFESPIPSDDEKEHNGIYNVRTRLSILCDGKLEVVSKSGEGTVSTIKIPKNRGGGRAS